MSDPSAVLDVRTFRDTVGLFATGVAVIVARAAGEVLAMTANAVSSVSLEPMLMLFCPSKRSHLASRLHELEGFSINMLRHDQQALSTYFAGGWKDAAPPPFRLVGTDRAPHLEGALATIHCEPWKLVDAGDHMVVIGRVLALHQGIRPLDPLLFFSGRYRHVRAADSAPAPDLSDVQDEPPNIFYD